VNDAIPSDDPIIVLIQRGNNSLKSAETLIEMPDEKIDLSDIPEISDWSGAVIGKFYRPVKEAVTVRLDADVVHWLKRDGKRYQARLNAILRREMERSGRKAA
jgi:uncharacterized protein (DUF4415 family)